MNKRYFYVAYALGAVMGGLITRTNHHPLHPEELEKIQNTLGIRNGVPPAAVTLVNVIELDEATARARYPLDFPVDPGIKDVSKPPPTLPMGCEGGAECSCDKAGRV